jgi:hypothetical protein
LIHSLGTRPRASMSLSPTRPSVAYTSWVLTLHGTTPPGQIRMFHL